MFQYYIDTTKFNLAFCVCCLAIANPFWVTVIFGTLGNAVGVLGYGQFHNNEYYTYYNLGFTKRKLIKTVCMINLLVAVPLMGLAILITFIF